MPESFSIDTDRGVVHCRAWGRFTSEELMAHYTRMRAHPEFDPGFRQLGDLRDVEEFDITTATVEAAAELPTFTPGTRRALVASETVQFGLARMFGSFAELNGQEVRVFRDYDEAVRWLTE